MLLLLVSLVLAAQDQSRGRVPSPDRLLGAGVDELKQSLGLKEEQLQTIKEIFEKTKAGLETIVREGRFREMRELSDAARAALRDVLDGDQKAKYDEVFRSMNQGFGRGAPSDVSMEELKIALELTPDQIESIAKIRNENREKMGRLWQGIQGRDDFQRVRDESEKLIRESRDETKAKLTEVQKTKYEELLAGQGGGRSTPPRERAQMLVRELKVEDGKAEAVTEALMKVLELQRAFSDQLDPLRRQLRDAIRSNASDEDIGKKLDEYHEKRVPLEKDLDEARAKLKGLLTKSQEARLVSDGVLR